jgi:hypothetical protein
MRAKATASSGVNPPSTQSVAEIRTLMGLSAGHTARQASNTSKGNAARASNDPPYASVRRLVTGDRKLDSRYPWAQWISSRSKPAASAPRADHTNWSRTSSMSARVISRGTWLSGE